MFELKRIQILATSLCYVAFTEMLAIIEILEFGVNSMKKKKKKNLMSSIT